ncbi:DUF5305 domain-containing protein [Halobellus marinus]|uniref:DUF5305 domain-containing protein n=1 Tax=Halobellus TaxID=1073986 RepID=UPI0028B1F0AF|nr:DUF5305 domain-containing protein [Halobellus sp. DFY28]
MANWLLRLRALLDEQFVVVVAALVVLALVGGWLTYTTHASPNTTTEERIASSWQTTGSFNHSATVTEKNSVYPVGTTLTNRSIYFTDISPWFNGTYTFRYDASERGDLNGRVALQFVLQSVEENQESTTVVWQTNRSLETTSSDSIQPGETIRVPFSVNMNETTNRTEVIDEQLDNAPGQPEVVIRATVDIQGTVNGQQVDHVVEHTLPVALEQGTYRPANQGRITDQYEATRTVTVQQTYGPLRTIGCPALLFGSGVVLGGLVAVRSRGRLALSSTEQELLAYEDEREDFDEWISTIKLPDEAFDLPRAEAASLGALVDFAIDTDNSVIEDPDDGAYYVVHDGYLYTYQPSVSRGEGRSSLLTKDDSDEPEQTGGESTVTPATDDEFDSSEGTPTDE